MFSCATSNSPPYGARVQIPHSAKNARKSAKRPPADTTVGPLAALEVPDGSASPVPEALGREVGLPVADELRLPVYRH